MTTIGETIHVSILILTNHTQNYLLILVFILLCITCLLVYFNFAHSPILQLLQQLARDGKPVLLKRSRVTDWSKVKYYHRIKILNQPFVKSRMPFKLTFFNVHTVIQIGQQIGLAMSLESLKINVYMRSTFKTLVKCYKFSLYLSLRKACFAGIFSRGF